MGLRARAIIGKKYELVDRLGHGGMGEIWKARCGAEEFALKFILPGLKDDESIVDRFKNEIRASMVLHGQHVVHARDFGWEPAYGPYLVMDYLVGKTLRTVLADGPIRNVALAVDYLLQAVEAVADAHRLGIVHRDLKPENLFLAEMVGGPILKVLDFGIARLKDDIGHLTQAGAFLGTRNYSSPEQFKNSVDVTERSDIWSLGAILYELLSGAKAFPGEDMAPVATILTSAPVALTSLRRDLPLGLVAAVERCLERDPELRFPDAEALRDALEPFSSSDTARDFAEAKTEFALGPATQRTGVAVRPVVRVGEPYSRRSGTRFPELGAMLDAICNGRRRDGSPRRVVFMLGAGFSLDAVPRTDEFVELIQEELSKSDRAELQNLQHKSRNIYQDAFRLLRNRKPNYEANKVVRTAVLRAYRDPVELGGSEEEQARQCETLEERHDRWTLPDGVEHLGDIIQAGLWRADTNLLKPGPIDWRFSAIHLTTNFDPLLSISVRRRGGTVVPYSVGKDGKLPKTTKQSCAIVHLHGRWDEGDTLHMDLDVPRPQLQDSLHELLNGSTLVVVGYGGWDDVFMRTLETVAARDNDFEVLWGFYELDQSRIEEQNGELVRKLTNALAPRIAFYRGIDTNSLFRDLKARVLDPSVVPPPPMSLRRVSDAPDHTPPPPPPAVPTPPPIAVRRSAPAAAVGALAVLLLLVGIVTQVPAERRVGQLRASASLAGWVRPFDPAFIPGRRLFIFSDDIVPCSKGPGCPSASACRGPGCRKSARIACAYQGAADVPELTKARKKICRALRPRASGKVQTKEGFTCDCTHEHSAK